MKLKAVSTTQGGLRQFTLRLNESEIQSLFAAIEIASHSLPKNPVSEDLSNLRHKVNNAKRELKRAKKELDQDAN